MAIIRTKYKCGNSIMPRIAKIELNSINVVIRTKLKSEHF